MKQGKEKRMNRKVIAGIVFLILSVAIFSGINLEKKGGSEKALTSIHSTSLSNNKEEKSEKNENGKAELSSSEKIETGSNANNERELTEAEINTIKQELMIELKGDKEYSYYPSEEEMSEIISRVSQNILVSAETKEQIMSSVTTELKEYIKENPVFAGKNGERGEKGDSGSNGKDGTDGVNGENGKDGYSPVKGVDYFTERDIETISNHVETSIIDSGELTVTGLDGVDGKSAYELAVEKGFEGSLEDWLETLKAKDGESAYAQAVAGGYEGTEEEFYTLLSTAGVSLNDLENHVDTLTKEIDRISQNFQNGCNTIASGITANGVETASNSSPDNMVKNIKQIYNGRYTEGYSQGYVDGQKSINNSATIQYKRHYHTGNSANGTGCYTHANYHNHSSSCYGICPGYWMKDENSWGDKDGNGDRRYRYTCSYCGKTAAEYGPTSKDFHGTHQSIIPTCGYNSGQILSYSLGCGCTEGQILSATITY